MTSFFFLSCALSVLSCIYVPRFLIKGGFLDSPTQRSSHSIPTPKGGGVGILLTFTGAAIVSGLLTSFWLPVIVLAGLSFINDLKALSPVLRLAVQFLAASAALFGAWWAGEIGWSGFLLLPAVIFVVATTNWFNFMDGINGIAGITGFIAFTCLALFGGMHEKNSPLLYTSVAVMGALVGFLPFNVPRARLFMGDAGSVFLGFFFAFCVCILAQTWTEFIVFTSFLFPFYADELVTLFERIWRGESLLVPHRRHLYQFLVNEMALEHWKISVGYGLLQAIMVFLVVSASQYGFWAVFGVDMAALVFWTTGHVVLKRHHSPRDYAT